MGAKARLPAAELIVAGGSVPEFPSDSERHLRSSSGARALCGFALLRPCTPSGDTTVGAMFAIAPETVLSVESGPIGSRMRARVVYSGIGSSSVLEAFVTDTVSEVLEALQKARAS